MSSGNIVIDQERTRFGPGDNVTGYASWDLPKAPKVLEVHLLWFTDSLLGRVDPLGDTAPQIIHTHRVARPGAQGKERFSFALPEGPYSFRGNLFSIKWALEFVLPQGYPPVRQLLTYGPGGHAIRLSQDPEAAVPEPVLAGV